MPSECQCGSCMMTTVVQGNERRRYGGVVMERRDFQRGRRHHFSHETKDDFSQRAFLPVARELGLGM